MFYIKYLIAPLSDILMFYIKYLSMYIVCIYAGAIKKILYGCVSVWEIILSLKIMGYLPIHTHKSYNNFHLSKP